MGQGLLPRKPSFSLLFKDLHELGFFQEQIIIKERSLCRKYYCSASSSLPLYDSDKAKPTRNSLYWKSRKLYSAVGRVCKSLSWEVVKEIPFKESLKEYGLYRSTNGYTMMIHSFAFAGMDVQMYILLEQMIFYLQKTGIGLYKLINILLHSSNDTATSILVADVLIKVFAENKQLDRAIDVVNQVKNMGLEVSIYSCNYLLKCLAVVSRRKNLAILFEAMKNFGPSPDVITYTIMMNFYCTNHPGKKVSIKEAYEILEEMGEKQISPSAATYSVWLHGLCRVGCPDVALKFIRKLRDEWFWNNTRYM